MHAQDTDNKVVSDDAELSHEKQKNDAADSKRIAPRKEIGGRKGPDPTRYGDWEKAGRCIDF